MGGFNWDISEVNKKFKDFWIHVLFRKEFDLFYKFYNLQKVRNKIGLPNLYHPSI